MQKNYQKGGESTLFEELGVEGMLSIGLILATLGLAVAMLAGMVWVNIGVRRGWAPALERSGAGPVRGPRCKDRELGNAIKLSPRYTPAVPLGTVVPPTGPETGMPRARTASARKTYHGIYAYAIL